jgi:hypothetical protein
MPLLISAFLLFIAFVIAAGSLWFLACEMSPLGYEVSFGRVVTAIILMAVSILLTSKFLAPMGGMMFSIPVFAAVTVLIVKLALRLSFSRSVVIALIYAAIWTIAWGFFD